MASTDWNSEDAVQCSAYGSKYLSDMDDGNDFTFVDFLPEIRDHVGATTKKIYENFRMLVERANDFLRSDRKWNIITCESIQFNLPDGQLDSSKMADKYMKYMGDTRHYRRGLRLWLRERQDANEREHQIGYVNIIPQELEEEEILSGSKYETLDAVIERINSMLQSQPLPGSIITIESQGMKCDNIQKFDVDCTNWTENWTEAQSEERFVFVLRIFYKVMPGISEETIGVKDFIPERIREGGIFGKDEYEPFSDLADKASLWRAQQQDIRICNIQTLEMRHIEAGAVNTQKMIYLKVATEEHFVRVLRVAYTKPFADSYSISADPSMVKQLTCRTFIPLQLSRGTCINEEYENLATTKERISAWVKATGVHILSAETKTYLIKRDDKTNRGSEASFANKGILRWHSWMYVIRLYIDGTYEEPPPQMLPPVRVPQEKSCCEVS